MAAADPDALPVQKVAQHPAPRERIFQMQLVDAAHQREVLGGHRLGLVIDAAAADVQDLGLADDGKVVAAVDHRFALSMPALMSAPSKKSFSSASSPILASSTFKSPGGAPLVASAPKTPAAPSSNCAFQAVI